jgi:heme/copper-type cytochrome/quinol oxidase subunit 2
MENGENKKVMEPQQDNKMPFIVGAVVLGIAVIGFFLVTQGSGAKPSPTPRAQAQTNQVMGDEASETTPDGDDMMATDQQTTPSAMTEDGVKTIEIEAGSFYFKPNVISVKKGEKVRVVIKSVDMMHDFYIDELNVKSPIVKSGTTGTVEFVASKVGTFEYYCSVGQHRKNGQVGKITVTE